MPQSLVQIYTHLVFSTKQRRPFFRRQDRRQRLHAYLIGACKNLKCVPIAVGGAEDHVHILCRLAKTVSVSDLVRDLKRESSKWLKGEFPGFSAFQWQAGYGAFSISPTHVNQLCRYIATQEEHHRTVSFQEELRRLCQKYGVEIDERYVWD
jgi:REP element-mobilizing transposase RayT